MDGASVRAATRDDAQDILGLIADNQGDGQILVVPLRKIEACIDEYLVAEKAGRRVGCGALHFHGSGSYEICSLSVRAEAQGQGIGSALLKALLKKAPRGSFVFLATDKPFFYRPFGFELARWTGIPGRVWLHKIGAMLDQDKAKWFKIIMNKYSVMRLAEGSGGLLPPSGNLGRR